VLDDSLALIDDLAEAREAIPLSSMRWSPPIEVWLSDPARYRVLRGPNGGGKSKAHAAEFVWRATGTHPFRECKDPPVKMAAYGFSHSSQEALMGDLWEYAQGTGLHPKCGYDPGRGITGKPPRLLWENGSYLLFLTYKQNSQAYAGKGLDYQGLDETCPESKWGEIEGRTREGGEVGLTLTPTVEGFDQTWVKEKIAEGLFSLTVSAICEDPDKPETIDLSVVTPRGGLPWLSHDRVAQKIRSWLSLERRMRCGLSWDAVAVGRQLDGYQPRHSELYYPPPGEVTGCCATDHGIDPGRQASVLVATDGHMIWVLGCYRPDVKSPRTSPKQDAQGVIRLLKEAAGWTPRDKLVWVGDRSAESKKWMIGKCNGYLAEAIAEEMGTPRDLLNGGEGLFIKVPHKPAGSVLAGLRLVNGLLIEDRVRFSPACKLLIESIMGWEGDPKDKRKDLIDAFRYAVEALVAAYHLRPPIMLAR